MLKQLTTSFHIRLSGRHIALLKRSGWLRPSLCLLAEETGAESRLNDPEAIINRLQELLPGVSVAGRSTTITLGDDLVRYFTVTPPSNAARLADCRAAAAMRFQSLYGEASSHWEISAEWDARASFLACAIPKVLRTGLLHLASLHKLHIVQMTPYFITAWNRWHARFTEDAWFGVLSPQWFTFGIMQKRRLHAVRSAPLSCDLSQDAQWLPSHLTREALMLGLPLPQRFQLCGDIPSDWVNPSSDSLVIERLDTSLKTPDALTNLALLRIAR